MTGFCIGVALSIASSVSVPEVGAAVAFHGVPSPELANPTQVKAPVLGHFGEINSFIGFLDIMVANSLVEKLKASVVVSEVHIYLRSAYDFMNRSPDCVKRRKSMGMADEDEDDVELASSRFHLSS